MNIMNRIFWILWCMPLMKIQSDLNHIINECDVVWKSVIGRLPQMLRLMVYYLIKVLFWLLIKCCTILYFFFRDINSSENYFLIFFCISKKFRPDNRIIRQNLEVVKLIFSSSSICILSLNSIGPAAMQFNPRAIKILDLIFRLILRTWNYKFFSTESSKVMGSLQ